MQLSCVYALMAISRTRRDMAAMHILPEVVHLRTNTRGEGLGRFACRKEISG